MFGKLTYINTPTVDVVDDYFGTKVADPYRWLEDDQDPAVLEWTGAQHDVTMELLTGLAGRDTFERTSERRSGIIPNSICRACVAIDSFTCATTA